MKIDTDKINEISNEVTLLRLKRDRAASDFQDCIDHLNTIRGAGFDLEPEVVNRLEDLHRMIWQAKKRIERDSEI